MKEIRSPWAYARDVLRQAQDDTSVARVRKSWNRFWFRDCPPHSLALLRIGFGLFLLIYWGLQMFQVPMRYSDQGILLPLVPSTSLFGLVFTPPPVIVAYIIYGFFLFSLFSFTIGYRTRVVNTLIVLLYGYYWILTLFHFGTSFDRLFMFSLVVFACSGAGKTYSLDMKIKKGSWTAWEPICILPVRLLAVQVTATYFGVGAQKIVLDAWQGGEVFIWGFMGRWATPPAFSIARLNIPIAVYDAVVHAIKFWEVSMPFMLWNKKTRWFAFITGALFHIGISILLSIWWFLPMIAMYILFVKPEEVADWLKYRKRL